MTVEQKLFQCRLLKKEEAAHYCSMSVRAFERQREFSPILMQNGDIRWDVNDLDRWIDSLKGGEALNADDIVGKLA